MEKYNYYHAVRRDVKKYILNNYTKEEIQDLINTREDSEKELFKKMRIDNNVTGNASGTYWFNTWIAEECICHNFDLLGEAIEEFGCEGKDFKKGAEWADVIIRCYLLPQSISEILDELEEEIELL